MSVSVPQSVRFVPRVPTLRRIEGWHEVDGLRFKISCRFHDILRCSEFHDKTRHFISCFRKGGYHDVQPLRRCQDPTWAIAYVPDKHGNFLGRAFLRWLPTERKLEIGKVYGNKLTQQNLRYIMTKLNLDCLICSSDTYLEGRSS